jgi:hypothetical protein
MEGQTSLCEGTREACAQKGYSRKSRVIVCAGCQTECETRGPQKWCASCAKEEKRKQDRRYYRSNADKLKADARAYQAANAERIAIRARAYREKHRDRIAQRKASTKDLDAARLRASAYYRANREKVLAKLKTDENRARARERESRKRLDPGYRLHTNVSRFIRAALGGGKRGRKWEALLGYTLDDLKAHIERQFRRGMTWENYGDWEIDHIRPRAMFKFENSDDPEFRECWALTNLRPLWARENAAKSGQRTHLL